MKSNTKTQAGVGLAPPEVTYYKEIQNSIGQDPLIRIGSLDEVSPGVFKVTIHVRGTRKARALATLLVLNKSLDNVLVKVRVKASGGKQVEAIQGSLSPKDIKNLYRTAFHTNRLFKFAALHEIFAKVYVFPVFNHRIIQFANDNLSDYYLNYNNVAAFVFKDVLRGQIDDTGIQFSTEKKD
jgi:hypothetical protein